jgi:hypothetical protein
MKTISLNLYQFTELDGKAREKALSTFRDINIGHDWWQFIFEDFVNLCNLFGITVDEQSIAFRGFWSQGDGSGFNAVADLTKLSGAIESELWKQGYPKLELNFPPLTIDRRVLGLIATGVIELAPRIIRRQRVYNIVVDIGLPELDAHNRAHDLIYGELDAMENWFEKVARVFNRHLYRSLEAEYDYLTADTAVEEAIQANGFLFTADGEFARRLEILSLT